MLTYNIGATCTDLAAILSDVGIWEGFDFEEGLDDDVKADVNTVDIGANADDGVNTVVEAALSLGDVGECEKKTVDGYVTAKSLGNPSKVSYLKDNEIACNPYRGCHHACPFCFAKTIGKKASWIKEDEDWKHPKMISNAEELVEESIKKHKGKSSTVYFSFLTDPFMYGYDDVKDMSLKLMKKYNDGGFTCNVITKGILPKELASDDYSKDNMYMITLVSLDEEYREKYEPGAAPLAQRLAALRYLKDQGCKVGISMEPFMPTYIVNQDLQELLKAVSFVDKIIFGRVHWGEVKDSRRIKRFYNEKAKEVIKFCEEHQISYHIKAGTMEMKKENPDGVTQEFPPREDLGILN